MARINVERTYGHFSGVSDTELTRLIDTVKVKPPLPPPPLPARPGQSQVTEVMVRNLREEWGRMR